MSDQTPGMGRWPSARQTWLARRSPHARDLYAARLLADDVVHTASGPLEVVEVRDDGDEKVRVVVVDYYATGEPHEVESVWDPQQVLRVSRPSKLPVHLQDEAWRAAQARKGGAPPPRGGLLLGGGLLRRSVVGVAFDVGGVGDLVGEAAAHGELFGGVGASGGGFGGCADGAADGEGLGFVVGLLAGHSGLLDGGVGGFDGRAGVVVFALLTGVDTSGTVDGMDTTPLGKLAARVGAQCHHGCCTTQTTRTDRRKATRAQRRRENRTATREDR